MSRLVPAYSRTTGKKLPYLVNEHTFDNPVYRGKISRTPKSAASQKKTTTNTPAAGDEKGK